MIKDKKSLKQWILGQICSDSVLCYIWNLHYTQMDRENILYEFCSSFAFTFITVNPYYCPLLYSLNVFLTCSYKLNVTMICKLKNRIQRM